MVERYLWSTIIALEEAAEIAELTPELGFYTLDEVRKKRAQAATLRDMLARAESPR